MQAPPIEPEPVPTLDDCACVVQWIVNQYAIGKTPSAAYAAAVATLLFRGGPEESPAAERQPLDGPQVVAALLGNARAFCEIGQALASLGRAIVTRDLTPGNPNTIAFMGRLPEELRGHLQARDGFTHDFPLVVAGPQDDPVDAFVRAVAQRGAGK